LEHIEKLEFFALDIAVAIGENMRVTLFKKYDIWIFKRPKECLLSGEYHYFGQNRNENRSNALINLDINTRNSVINIDWEITNQINGRLPNDRFRISFDASYFSNTFKSLVKRIK
jgi:hypothetical protein